MKTKLIILAAIAAILYSCSIDRDEDLRKEAIESVKKNNQEKFKLNQPGLQSKETESNLSSDTIRVRSSNNVGLGLAPEDPEDGNEVVDPTKPDKPW